MNRTNNATRNILFGAIMKIYQTLIPFLMRTAMIYFMGVQYLGLNSLFASVLQVLNLAELGVGGAIVFSLYEPLAKEDKKTICALMKLYRLYYRIIGIVIAILGCLLLPFIPKLINGEVPEGINIYVLYIMNLAATVLSYWLFAYRNCLLSAHQREDIVSKIKLLTYTIQYSLQLLVLFKVQDYYIYILVALFTQALNNIITAIITVKLYPQYKPCGCLVKEKVAEINHRVRDLFTSKIGMVVVNSVDTIVISAFLGLTLLAMYQNYYYILNSIIGFMIIIYNSCRAGIGNSLVVETKEKNFADMNKLVFLISWISGMCVCCFLCLFQPFMTLWMGKDLLLPFSVVICFCVYFYVYQINQVLVLYKDAGGLWHEDRFRPIVTAGVNLIMNLVTVQFWEIYGVVLSTVLSTVCVGMPWLLHNLFSVMFERKHLRRFLSKLIRYILSVIIASMSTYIVCIQINLPIWVTLFCRLLVCIIVPNILFYLFFRKTEEFRGAIELVQRMLKGNRKCGERQKTN